LAINFSWTMTKAITFLLVDDDEDDSMLFEEVLQECDPEIHFMAASNGKEALDMLTSEGIDLPDLIFLDLNMPRMDGKECLSKMKQHAALAQIPVIIYTTSFHLKDIEETRKLGAIGFITKPSDIQDLQMILGIIVEHFPQNLKLALRALSQIPTHL